MTKTIVNNEVLFSYRVDLERVSTLHLCRQSYSDGTCYYTLKDNWGNWKLNHGNKDVTRLIEQLQHEIRIEEESAQQEHNKNNPAIENVYKLLIERKRTIIKDMESLVLQAV